MFAFVQAGAPLVRPRHGSAVCGLRRARPLAPQSPAVVRVAAPRMNAEAPEAPPSAASSETFEFQAEVSRVMNLIINSLYSNKEVFLRELVSNAADACDKKRFLSLSSETAVPEDEMKIYVRADKDKGIITIEDSGVGMTRQELISNLGSIATSGTNKFAEALGDASSSDVSLIGQFGVGFYSAYLVADKVFVTSKSFTDPNAKQYTWESNADSSFTVSEDGPDSQPLQSSSGTRIVLHVKDGCKEFLENYRLNDLLKRYSEFIGFPIMAWTERTEMEEVPDGEEKDDEGNQKMKKVPKTIEEWSQVNKLKPIWMRRPREVEQSDYIEFYKSISRDFQDPLAHTHFAVEGEVEFRAILYTPKSVPMELRQNMFDESGRLLKLYVKRIFISENFEDILPRWLCFVRGVVDSDDLPLNVSREILQQSRVLRTISKRLIRKSLDMFKSIKERDNDDYVEFWKQYGRYLKAGIVESGEYMEDLSKLTLWPSTASKDELSSLDDYVSRMKENQNEIYYVAGSSRSQGEAVPAMEKLRDMGYEVIFLVEPVDEIAIQNMVSYKAKKNESDSEPTSFKFVDVTKEDLNLSNLKTEEEKKEDEKVVEEYKPVEEFMMRMLSGKVGKVRVSDRLTDSASAMTQSSFGMSPTMEKYMREVGAGAMSDPGMEGYLMQARILEINPRHPLVKDIKVRLEGATGGDDEQTRQTAMLVYELALLTGGYDLADTAAFARRVSSFVSSAVTAPEVAMPAPQAQPAEAEVESGLSDSELKKMVDESATKKGSSTGKTPTTADVIDVLKDAGVEKKDVEIL